MAHLIQLPTFSDSRGDLTVIDKIIPFEIRRVYYIYNSNSLRGGHRHKRTYQALVCPKGHCEVFVDDGRKGLTFQLNNPSLCLILNPEDWHTMDKFTDDCVLLVLASEHFDPEDYISENNS
jgi:dTDP-4-dehydrorhamnose 3,5-epimerase-like enzyme